ncbi:hypothetical protein EA797_13790 [Stutzerimonas zhaodongensis]|uniref:Uncharacterized protein n=1 Tax=Stutzerimonas zhaodongensis TaxID=1176257 RepID=A0A3M2HT30_9GAMM|nr:hypothetical protein EA797_13790 [Stutzerimonas zhaodongensis]
MPPSLSEFALSLASFCRKGRHQAPLKLFGAVERKGKKGAHCGPIPEREVQLQQLAPGALAWVGTGGEGRTLEERARSAWRVQAGVQITDRQRPSAVIAPGRKAQ